VLEPFVIQKPIIYRHVGALWNNTKLCILSYDASFYTLRRILMPLYYVSWEIQLDADSPIDAAKQAYQLLKDSEEDGPGLNFEVRTNVDLGADNAISNKNAK
jgi:hypothetical protein